ncbi:hypothetical protein IAR50_002579 [Cryptococcus sp. DSM 104548]
MDSGTQDQTPTPPPTRSPPSTTPCAASPLKNNKATSEQSPGESVLQAQITCLQTDLDTALFSNISIRQSLSDAQVTISELQSTIARHEAEKGEKERAERREKALEMQVDRLQWKIQNLEAEMKKKEEKCRMLEKGKEWESKYRALKRGIDALAGGGNPSLDTTESAFNKKPRVSLYPDDRTKPTPPSHRRHSIPSSAKAFVQHDELIEISDAEVSGESDDDDEKDGDYVYGNHGVEEAESRLKSGKGATASQRENTSRLLASLNSAHRHTLSLRSLPAPRLDFTHIPWKKEKLAELMVRFVNLPGSKLVEERDFGKPGGMKTELITRVRDALDSGLIYFEALPPDINEGEKVKETGKVQNTVNHVEKTQEAQQEEGILHEHD